MAGIPKTPARLPVGLVNPDVRDGRAEFWQRHFAMARPYEQYLAESDPQRAQLWHALSGKLPALTDEQQARLRGYGRRLNVLMYSGLWCGDCIRQGPMLRAIAEAGEGIELRLIDREASQPLQEELRILGGRRVPVMVFLSEDFYEIQRVGDRLLSFYRARAHLDLGASCDIGLAPPPGKHLSAELADWVDVVERVLLMARLSPRLRARHQD